MDVYACAMQSALLLMSLLSAGAQAGEGPSCTCGLMHAVHGAGKHALCAAAGLPAAIMHFARHAQRFVPLVYRQLRPLCTASAVSSLQGFKLPFDRHDWIVDRCGREVRYVIDFYSGAPQPGVPASMHLDVRPALDSLEALWDRLRMQAGWVASGRWKDE
jgi:hypothetical protein